MLSSEAHLRLVEAATKDANTGSNEPPMVSVLQDDLFELLNNYDILKGREKLRGLKKGGEHATNDSC